MGQCRLSWERHDLHGLLWQRLINAAEPHGDRMRQVCRQVSGYDPTPGRDVSANNWLLPDALKREGEVQRLAFERLAGPWMGRDRRRGVPYAWSVSHLADGRGQTSPRSFLAAIRQAVEDSQARYPQYEFAIHYESLKRGIQQASENRVNEVAEDDPWVIDVLSALQGRHVPCTREEIQACWEQRFPAGPGAISANRLPAQHAVRGWDGIVEDRKRLGMIVLKSDGRIDMPDLYRVGFGLGRKGGIRPRS